VSILRIDIRQQNGSAVGVALTAVLSLRKTAKQLGISLSSVVRAKAEAQAA